MTQQALTSSKPKFDPVAMRAATIAAQKMGGCPRAASLSKAEPYRTHTEAFEKAANPKLTFVERAAKYLARVRRACRL